MLHVVVGILRNKRSEVLITKRRSGTHLAGLWEFPGGKLESGESRLQALSRELHEELGVEINQAEPFIRIHHHYPERSVLLDVWKVSEYKNKPFGREQQPLQWVMPDQLHRFKLPPADDPILKALLLPDRYVILDADNRSVTDLQEQIVLNAAQHCSVFFLRGKRLNTEQYTAIAINLIEVTRQMRLRLLLNSTVDQVVRLGASGLHLSTLAASSLEHRPLGDNYILGVSCHSANELEQAQRINADFALLSPVCHTQSHPDSKPLGWEQFACLSDQINIPVYALGGLDVDDINTAKQFGAQGVAGISAFQ